MIRPTTPPSMIRKVPHRTAAGRTMRGLSLIELMVAITAGLLVLVGLISIYLDSSRSGNEFSKMNRQIENGRFALQILREDLWHAGYWGEFSPENSPTALPDPCIAFSSWDAPYKENLLAIPTQGYDNATSLPASCTMVSNRQSGTDVLFIRHADNCVAGASGCEAETAGKLYFQASLCSKDETDFATTPYYVMDTDSTQHTLRKRDSSGKSCTATGYTNTLAGKRKVVSHLYYIRNYAVSSGDGIPTLVRSELDLSSGAVEHQAAQPLVEGIQHLEIEYGIDSDNDGEIDSFSTAPATAADWGNVIAAKIYLLARNLETTPGHSDTKTYRLGATSLGPFNDGYKRHVYSAFVRLNNPAGRRE